MEALIDWTADQTFRENLQREMDIRGISQSELARRAGMNQTAISSLLAGRNEPRLSTIERIAAAFG
jgi:transcriptional regulator with XRE-family HTH domain